MESKFIHIPSVDETFIKERGLKAEQLFRQGYNCSQSVALAFGDLIEAGGGPSSGQLAALATGFGGGMGRMREVCGTVSGMTLVAGLACPAGPAGHQEGNSAKQANYALVQEMAGEFRAINGSIICRELLGLAGTAPDSPAPSSRTESYYKKRPCAELCRIAAEIVARHLTNK